MKSVYEALVLTKILYSKEIEMIKKENQNGIVCNQYCQYHANMVGHTIQDYAEFRRMVQDLIDEKEIEFSSKEEHSINVIIGTTYLEDPSLNGLRPITIFHDNLPVKEKTSETPKPVLVIEVPKPFPYTSNKMVS